MILGDLYHGRLPTLAVQILTVQTLTVQILTVQILAVQILTVQILTGHRWIRRISVISSQPLPGRYGIFSWHISGISCFMLSGLWSIMENLSCQKCVIDRKKTQNLISSPSTGYGGSPKFQLWAPGVPVLPVLPRMHGSYLPENVLPGAYFHTPPWRDCKLLVLYRIPDCACNAVWNNKEISCTVLTCIATIMVLLVSVSLFFKQT
jgi:hypothetical protein